MEHKRTIGQFWILDNPEPKVIGTINFDDNEGVTLTTVAPVGHDLQPVESRETEIIQGMTAEHHVKLVNCFVVSTSDSLGLTSMELLETTWYCRFAFFGDHYEGASPSNIKSAQVSIQSLENWATGFEGIQVESSDQSTLVSWDKKQPDLSCRWSLGRVSIRQNVGVSQGLAGGQTIKMVATTDTSFVLEFDEPQSWDEVTNTIGNLQAMLSIAKGEAVRIEKTDIVEGGKSDARLSAYYRPLMRPQENSMEYSELFTMSEMGGISGISKWLNRLSDQMILTNALLIDKYQHPALITDRTGHLLIACEAYQRPKMCKPEKQMELRQDILKPMLAKSGRLFQQWVGDKGTWMHQVAGIRNRLVLGQSCIGR